MDDESTKQTSLDSDISKIAPDQTPPREKYEKGVAKKHTAPPSNNPQRTKPMALIDRIIESSVIPEPQDKRAQFGYKLDAVESFKLRTLTSKLDRDLKRSFRKEMTEGPSEHRVRNFDIAAQSLRQIATNATLGSYQFQRTQQLPYMRKNLALGYKKIELLKGINTSIRSMEKALVEKLEAIKINTSVRDAAKGGYFARLRDEISTMGIRRVATNISDAYLDSYDKMYTEHVSPRLQRLNQMLNRDGKKGTVAGVGRDARSQANSVRQRLRNYAASEPVEGESSSESFKRKMAGLGSKVLGAGVKLGQNVKVPNSLNNVATFLAKDQMSVLANLRPFQTKFGDSISTDLIDNLSQGTAKASSGTIDTLRGIRLDNEKYYMKMVGHLASIDRKTPDGGHHWSPPSGGGGPLPNTGPHHEDHIPPSSTPSGGKYDNRRTQHTQESYGPPKPGIIDRARRVVNNRGKKDTVDTPLSRKEAYKEAGKDIANAIVNNIPSNVKGHLLGAFTYGEMKAREAHETVKPHIPNVVERVHAGGQTVKERLADLKEKGAERAKEAMAKKAEASRQRTEARLERAKASKDRTAALKEKQKQQKKSKATTSNTTNESYWVPNKFTKGGKETNVAPKPVRPARIVKEWAKDLTKGRGDGWGLAGKTLNVAGNTGLTAAAGFAGSALWGATKFGAKYGWKAAKGATRLGVGGIIGGAKLGAKGLWYGAKSMATGATGIGLAGMAGNYLSDKYLTGTAKRIGKTASSAMELGSIGFMLGGPVGAAIGATAAAIYQNSDQLIKLVQMTGWNVKSFGDMFHRMGSWTWTKMFGRDAKYDWAGRMTQKEESSVFGDITGFFFGKNEKRDRFGNITRPGEESLFGRAKDMFNKTFFGDTGKDGAYIPGTSIVSMISTKAGSILDGFEQALGSIKDSIANSSVGKTVSSAATYVGDKAGAAFSGLGGMLGKIIGYEGGSKTTTDTGGFTKYGISAKNNPGVDIAHLTEAQARDIYTKKYATGLGLEKLSPQAQFVALDASVNQGPGYAKKLISQTGGDPNKMIAVRKQMYQNLAAKNPGKYGKYLSGWENRLNKVANDMKFITPESGSLPATSQATPTNKKLSPLEQQYAKSGVSNKLSTGTPTGPAKITPATTAAFKALADNDNAKKTSSKISTRVAPAKPTSTPPVNDNAKAPAAPPILSASDRDLLNVPTISSNSSPTYTPPTPITPVVKNVTPINDVVLPPPISRDTPTEAKINAAQADISTPRLQTVSQTTSDASSGSGEGFQMLVKALMKTVEALDRNTAAIKGNGGKSNSLSPTDASSPKQIARAPAATPLPASSTTRGSSAQPSPSPTNVAVMSPSQPNPPAQPDSGRFIDLTRKVSRTGMG